MKSLILAICLVESGGNCDAYNESENAVGPMQIRPCVVQDVTGLEIEHSDCYDADVSAEVFKRYVKRYGAETAEEAARIWNGGPDGAEQDCTLGYWKKVKSKLEEL